MENLIVGKPPIELNHLNQLILASPSSNKNLVETWQTLAQAFNVPVARVKNWELKLETGVMAFRVIFLEILKHWVSSKGSAATLSELCRVLLDCEMKDTSELLESTFWLVAVKSVKVKFYDHVVDLQQLIENASEGIYRIIYDTLKKTNDTQPIELLTEAVIPKDIPNYYIPRTLYRKNQVDEKIFDLILHRNIVLLVKGITIHELAKISKNQNIDTSGSQLSKLTVRLILLENDEHFDLICKKTKDPVHVIENVNGSFYLIKSNQGSFSIPGFIKETRSNCNERELVNNLASTHTPCVLSIADSPGTGKTLLLQSIAKTIVSREKSIVLIWTLHEFSNQLKPIRNPNAALTAIKDYACTTEVSKIILEEILKNESFRIYLCLDAYDKVSKKKTNLIKLFLKNVKTLKKICVLVTTRTYIKFNLEIKLGTISYQILSLNESQKQQLICSCLMDTHGVKISHRLQDYATDCLDRIYEQLVDKKKEITGVPYLCEIFARSYAEGAVKTSTEGVWYGITSNAFVFNTYNSLFKQKFENKELLSVYNAHIHASINLLFPDSINKFEPHLKGFNQVEETSLFTLGLIERRSFLDMPKFIHKTFADYLLAQYLVSNFNDLEECRELVFTVIFGVNGVEGVDSERKHGPPNFKLNSSVLAFFLNMLWKDQIKQGLSNLVGELALRLFPYFYSYFKNDEAHEKSCKAVLAIASHGFEILFDFMTKLYLNVIYKEHLIARKDKYFKLLPHFVVLSSNCSVFLLNKVLKFTEDVLNTDLGYHIYETEETTSHPWISGSTPLHIAMFYGNDDMTVLYLMEKYADRIRDMKYLVHSLVNRSDENKEYVIDCKLSIIKPFLDIAKHYNVNWLEELKDGRVPFLEENVHLRLLQKLVDEAGVDINTVSQKYGTVLHTSRNISDYNELVQFAFSNGFSAVNCFDFRGVTPLMCFLCRLKASFSENDKILELFYQKYANFNAEDANGDSVLFYALKNSETPVAVIEKIIDYEANVNHLNLNGDNAAHLLMNLYQPNPLASDTFDADRCDVLNKFKMLMSRGFNLLGQANFKHETPLDNALQYTEDIELFSLFRSYGVDFFAKFANIKFKHPTIHEIFIAEGMYEPLTQPENSIESKSDSTDNFSFVPETSLKLYKAGSSDVALPTYQYPIVPDTNKLIGRGSVSKVYEGRYGDRCVAVKTMKVPKREIENVRREIEILIHCDKHVNIVRYFCENHYESKGQIKYELAMELCETTLSELIEDKEASLEKLNISEGPKATDVLRQVTDGLFHLHNLKEAIIHRDLKPENVLLTTTSNGIVVVKLTDFGISKIMAKGKTHHTTKNFAGTFGWIAPEILHAMFTNKASAPVTKQTDIFSLGCLFYYVLSNGKHPFSDRTPSSKSEYGPKLEFGIIEDPSHYNLLRLILFMISFDAEERPFIEDIKHQPSFWTSEKRLLFLTESFDLSSQDDLTQIEKWLKANYQELAGGNYSNFKMIFSDEEEFKNGWLSCLQDNIQNALSNQNSKSPTKYNGKSFIYLLKGIRNLKAHFREKDVSVQDEVGHSPENFLNYWQSKNRFPFLLDYLWTSLQSINSSKLQRYYEGISFDFTRIGESESKFLV